MTVHMSFEEASRIMTENPNSQLVMLPKKQHIKLSPKYIGSVKTGVSEVLKSQLTLLNRELDGVPVAFRNIKAIQRLGRVIADQPCLHFDIEAEFILFKPTVGCTLKGVINKVGKKHVGCLVHGCFNAWFPRSDVTTPPDSNLLSKEVEFTVLEVFSNNRVVSLKGKFFSLVSGPDPSNGVICEAELDGSQAGDIGDLSSSPIIPIMTSTQIETPVSNSKKHKKHKKLKQEQTDHRMSDSGLMSPSDLLNGDMDSLEERTNSSKHSKKKKMKKERNTSVQEDSVMVEDVVVKSKSVVGVDKKPSKRKFELLGAETGDSSMEFVSPKKKVKKEKQALDLNVSGVDDTVTKKHKKSKKKKLQDN